MRLGVRAKLVLLSLLILVVVSFSFTWLQIRLSRAWFEEDLRTRAVIFAREVAATIGDRREFENRELLQHKIRQIMAVRQSVFQLDVLGFNETGSHIVATSYEPRRLPFTRREGEKVRQGDVVSHMVTDRDGRSWEVMAPIRLEGDVVGAIAAKFSLSLAASREARLRGWDLALTAISVLLMGSLMGLAVHVVVTRPVRRLVDAIRHVDAGHPDVPVRVESRDEFGVLGRHFNEMLARIEDFNSELQARVKEATSELERRYHEVQRMQRSLSHAERLALAGRIMAEVAHEVGTPLHSVAGHLELLRQDLPRSALNDDVRRRLSIIDAQLARVTQIIAQLLDLTRRTPGEPEAVDVNRLVTEIAEVVRPGIVAAGLRLDATTQPSLPPIEGYANQLQQVVLNLLTNAVDATPAGGRIAVATSARERHVELAVSDTGRGIPTVEQTQIFEPFFSTKGGSGLGLFISAQIVREHHGRIEVTSEPGQGSTFRVLLPVGERA
jgi:two-component system NtrC family sensor kinase